MSTKKLILTLAVVLLLAAAIGVKFAGFNNQEGAKSKVNLARAQGALITTVKLKELNSQAVKDYPLTISQVFKKGEISSDSNINVKLNSNTIDSQINVLRHYDDNSVKHALISLILPQLNANQEISLELYNESTVPPAGSNLNLADLLSTDFDAQVKFDLATGGTKTISARDLIASGSYTARYQGPIASEFILQGQPTDELGNPDPVLQVEFVIRRYQGIDGAKVDIAVDNTFTELDQITRRGYDAPKSDGDITYDTTISLGSADPQTVYQKNNVIHYFAARWRKVFWWNDMPGNVQMKPDIEYLISTKLIPDYDTSIIISPITSYEPYDILENGIITPYFGTTGERADIGAYPEWAASYIFSQGAEDEERLLNTGDLSGSFSIHLKKRNVNRIYSINDDPIITLLDGAYGHHPLEYSKSTPYTPDTAHQPSLAYIPYLLTGDKYYLDEMYYWANYSLASYDPGPRGQEKGLLSADSQARGQAWVLRQLVDAASFALDNSYEKSYFDEKVQNNIQNWTKIFIGPPELNPFGWYCKLSNWAEDGGRPDPNMSPDVRYYTLPWHTDWLIWSLDHAVQAEYIDAVTPRNWMMKFLIGRFTNSPDYDPMDGAPYHIAVESISGNQYSTWKELWDNSFFNGGGHNEHLGGAYSMYARADLTIAVRDNLPDAMEAYSFVATQLGDSYKGMLKWAFKGEIPEPDEILPATITDLYVSPGARGGFIALTWTATGDDDINGQAKNYIIKYADFLITEDNWDNAITFEQSLTPKPSGEKEVLEITGLMSSKTYYFAIKAQDDFGNLSGISNVPSILVPNDTDAPIITGVSTKTIKDTEATIIWTTDEPANSQVEFGLDTNYGITSNLDANYIKSHQTTITGLSANTTYHYRVISIDQNNNKAQSSDNTFKTSDFTPPVISNVQTSNIQSMQATITWDTDEAATSQVEYGTTTSYGSQSNLDSNLVISHTVILTNLTADTIYHFRVKSKDLNNNQGQSSDYTFQTPPFGGKIEVWGENEISSHKNTIIDANLRGDSPQTNIETNPKIEIFTSYGRMALIYFNLSDIPSGSAISKATLKLYVSQWTSGCTAELHYITDPDQKGMWTKNGVSYRYRDNANKIDWTQGAVNPHFAEGALVDSVAIPRNTSSGWFEFDVSEAVQNWVNNIIENQGLFLKPNPGAVYFYSSDYTDASLRPILEISWTPPTPNLTLTKTASAATAAPGDTIIYTITYNNIGAGDATKVIITDPIPAGTTYVPNSARFVSGPTGAIDDKTSTISWTIASAPASQGGSVEMRVMVAE